MRRAIVLTLFLALLVLLASLTYTLRAKAIDLGAYGETASIKEEDLEEHIISKLKSLDQEKLQEYQESVVKQTVQNIKRPKPVGGINRTSVYTQRFFDPSTTLEEDIYIAPGKLLHAKGTIINPLDYKAFDEVWILIDGDDISQVIFAKEYKAEGSKHKKIILVNGTPGGQEDGNFFYFDQAGEISKKLNIEKVPSVVSQITGRNDISIEEIDIDENGVVKSDKKS